jgi:hypothetical protein
MANPTQPPDTQSPKFQSYLSNALDAFNQRAKKAN